MGGAEGDELVTKTADTGVERYGRDNLAAAELGGGVVVSASLGASSVEGVDGWEREMVALWEVEPNSGRAAAAFKSEFGMGSGKTSCC